ncbi:hypothetical protein [Anthocerotibacter panamensis]|uniref:hypothetical protein n=1 Tax=Anthocerotibacter panamensis TaxID=2857077 RepID=UPI001C407D9A|nr:hypothetical protein [Anthocerotibacter panamensis]
MSTPSSPSEATQADRSIILGETAAPAGFAAPLQNLTDRAKDLPKLAQLAKKILADPLLLRQCSDQVYALLLEDLSSQRTRSRNNGRFY